MNHFSWARFTAIFMKEWQHILRDRFTLIFSLLLPFLVVIILGNSVEFNLREIRTVLVDQDHSQEARQLVEAFGTSNYFKFMQTESPQMAMTAIVEERAKAALIIPPQFGRDLRSGKNVTVQVLLDGADNSSVAAIANYLNTIGKLAVNKILHHGKTQTAAITFAERYLFNHELDSKWFTIPGLAAVIIAIVAILLTALTICREWEQGSMELLLSTPVNSSELMLGKIAPYAILSSIGFLIVYLSARIIFGVPMRGSHLILFAATLLFIVSYLGIGLFISVTTKSQQLAVQKAMIIGLLPTTLLSGFIFPVEYMPKLFRYATVFFPPRWYVEIARNQFLQGSPLHDLALPFVLLAVQAIFIVGLAIIKFKRSLE